MAFNNIPIERVHCGFASTYCISTKGEVYSWGSGANGRLGLGDFADHLRPCRISSLEAVRAIGKMTLVYCFNYRTLV